MSKKLGVLDAMRIAFTEGTPYAAFHLGVVYLEGWGVRQSDKRAFDWFQASAEAGCSLAYYHLAWAYSTGRGVARNKKLAKKWFARSAATGDSAAQYWLAGELVENGDGKDKAKGLREMHRLSKTDGTAAVFLCSYYLRKHNLTQAKRFAAQAKILDDEHANLWVAEVARAIAARKGAS